MKEKFTGLNYKIDATNQILGRLASKVSIILRGKNSPNFEPNIVPNIKVFISNTDKMKFSGRKIEQKVYYKYSGYPSGLKEKKLKELWDKKPELVFKKAVYGMLPKNRLREKLLKNLKFEN